MRRALLLLALLAAPRAAAAGQALPVPPLPPGSEVEVEFSTPFWEPVPGVAVPIRVEVRNRAAAARRLDVLFTATGAMGSLGVTCRTRQEMAVGAGETRRFEFAVPLCPHTSGGWQTYLTASLSGDVSAPETQLLSRQSLPPTGTSSFSPPLAMSEHLAVSSWEPLRAQLAGAGVALLGSRFLADDLPHDWRGLAGLSLIVMADDEWRGLAPAPREALQDWMAAGGTLLRTQAAGDAQQASGLGRSAAMAGAAPERLAAAVQSSRLRLPLLAAGDDDYGSWPLRDRLGSRTTPTRLLGLVVMAYALAVGPLNLWAFRGPRRHHVLWATPLVSAVACLFIAAAIFLSDGTGGTGHRLTAAFLQSGRGRLVVLQEQVSRTSLLTSRGFAAREPYLITPLAFADAVPPRRLERAKDSLGGDWFATRSLQGHLLEVVKPTRARVELQASPQGPQLLSTVAGTLSVVYLRDGQGRVWSASEVKPGVAAPLQPASAEAAAAWWKERVAPAGATVRWTLGALGSEPEPGRFLATVRDAAEGALPTLERITWNDSELLLAGDVLEPR